MMQPLPLDSEKKESLKPKDAAYRSIQTCPQRILVHAQGQGTQLGNRVPPSAARLSSWRNPPVHPASCRRVSKDAIDETPTCVADTWLDGTQEHPSACWYLTRSKLPTWSRRKDISQLLAL